jgi:hypothetical protein
MDQNYIKYLCPIYFDIYFDFNGHQGRVYFVILIEDAQCFAVPSGHAV